MPLLYLLAFASPAFANHPPGEAIVPAVAVDITPSAFAQVTAIAADLIPASITIPDVRLEGSEETCLIWCWNWYEYLLTTAGLDVAINLDHFDLVPETGRLRLDVQVDLNVASAQNPGNLYAYGEVIDLISVTEDCDVWLDPTPISVSTVVDASLVNGQVDFNIRPIDINLDISQLHIEGCLFGDILDLIDVINDIVGFFGFDIYQIIADAAEPLVENQINALLPQIESTLEQAFGALTIETSVPLGDSSITISVEPSQLDITPAGMRLGLAGSVAPDGPPAPCISRYRHNGSIATPGTPPDIGAGQDVYFHMLGVYVDDDFVNEALFSVWYGGLLCFTLDSSASSGLDLPIALDTSLLNLLTAGGYDDLFPTAAPLVINTRPTKPPVGSFSGAHDIDATLDGMGVDLLAELDGRLSRVAGLELAAEAGVDLTFDDFTGNLAVGVAFNPDDLDFQMVFNDLRPENSDKLVASLGGLIGTVVGPLLDGLTGGLAFPLPAINGLGIQEIFIDPAGPQGDFMGLYTTVGTVRYTNDTTDCTSGCSTGCQQGSRPGMFWAAPLALLVALRRRRG